MNRGLPKNPEVELDFYLPPEQLRPFITTFYHMRITGTRAHKVIDWLHPEWANLRIVLGGSITAAVGDGEKERMTGAVLTGPTSCATYFSAGDVRTWGIGILPLGWARFTEAKASDFADRACDPADHPLTQHLAGAEAGLRSAGEDIARGADALGSFFSGLLGREAQREEEIVKVQSALIDPACHSVGALAESLAMTPRTLERFCLDVFGFPPQLLLRRQRFLRSLAQFMLDPSMKWVETIDPHYHDQAHFVRDFKFFMGMTPREYGALDHPVLMAAAKARMKAAGAAMQVLHQPTPAPPK